MRSWQGDRRPLVVKHEKITPGILLSFPTTSVVVCRRPQKASRRSNPLDDVLCRLVPCSGILPCFCVLLVSTAWLSSALLSVLAALMDTSHTCSLCCGSLPSSDGPGRLSRARPLATAFFFRLQSTDITALRDTWWLPGRKTNLLPELPTISWALCGTD